MAARMRMKSVAAVQLRRMYVDCRYGQMHLTTAFPPSGGFDEQATLVCLHRKGGSGADFRALAALVGVDRSVYAPDFPGCGASDGPSGAVSASDLAAAVGDLLDQLRLRELDLLGWEWGADVALELAATRASQVRRVVIAGRELPAAMPAQPLLQLPGDAARLIVADPATGARQLRSFLDRPA